MVRVILEKVKVYGTCQTVKTDAYTFSPTRMLQVKSMSSCDLFFMPTCWKNVP